MKKHRKFLRLPAVVCAICLTLLSLPIYITAAPGDATVSDLDELMGRTEAYDYIRSEIEKASPSIRVQDYGLNTDELKKIMSDIFYHSPELFFFGGAYSNTRRTDGIVVDVTPSYTVSADELPAAREDFDCRMNELYAMRHEDWSDLEIILFYHDYLASHFEYDLTYAGRSAYAILQNGRGVCQAYSLLFTAVMNHFGIPCTYAKSDAVLNHIWNIVYVDGGWYHLDVTWDDPIYDRPGAVCHTYFLTGEDSIALDRRKSTASDIVCCAPVTVSAGDHPANALIGASQAPFVFLDGTWYGIFSEPELAAVSFADLTKQKLLELQDRWPIPGSYSYYPGNYSCLCSDGVYLYYHTDRTVYRYDTRTGTSEPVASCEETTAIYGLGYPGGGTLLCYTGTSPNEQTYGVFEADIARQIFYTITWVIGDQVLRTSAPEGGDPAESFTGSTYREDENGVRYTFAGWSPELAPVSGDAVYTALYTLERLYKPGDANGDDILNIMDVTAVLAYLEGAETYLHAGAADANENGEIDITDVTAILTILAQ